MRLLADRLHRGDGVVVDGRRACAVLVAVSDALEGVAELLEDLLLVGDLLAAADVDLVGGPHRRVRVVQLVRLTLPSSSSQSYAFLYFTLM